MRPAALAFDTAASGFDARFGEWLSVTAQRDAVRHALLEAFPANGRILEIGGGTGEDAAWLTQRGFDVVLTDAAPAMVRLAARKLAPLGGCVELLAIEDLENFVQGQPFDGAFSNFAPLNCVRDLTPVGRGLARLVTPGGAAVLVLFGRCTPGEILVECLRGRPRQSLRRFSRGDVPARLGEMNFVVRYHHARDIHAAMRPWFRLKRRLGVGIFVPPSAAEPWISRHPRLLMALARLDRVVRRPLALLGDHVLYHFERTEVPSP